MKKLLRRWKNYRDEKKAQEMLRLAQGFWSEIYYKDVVTVMLFNTLWTVEELEELSNLCGREAHERGRIER